MSKWLAIKVGMRTGGMRFILNEHEAPLLFRDLRSAVQYCEEVLHPKGMHRTDIVKVQFQITGAAR